MKWFKHETSDRNKVESKLIKAKFGIEGYGIYISLLEVIGENIEGHNQKDWGHVNGMHDITTLADECCVTPDKLREFLKFCDDRGIFQKRHKKLYSPLILDRLDEFAMRVQRGVGVTPDSLRTESRLSPARVEEKRVEEKRVEKTTAPDKPERSINYLRSLPEEDLKEFAYRFDASPKQVQSKAEDLLNYCSAKGKVYKNYKAFLINALKKDFKEMTDEERARRKETAERVEATRRRIIGEVKEIAPEITVSAEGLGELERKKAQLKQKMSLNK
jgi:hypothetical protein